MLALRRVTRLSQPLRARGCCHAARTDFYVTKSFPYSNGAYEVKFSCQDKADHDWALGVLDLGSSERLEQAKDLVMQKEELDAKIASEEATREAIRRTAMATAPKYAWMGVAFFSAEFGGMYYGTYELYSWDIMEPISWLLGMVDVIAAYTFFAVHAQDYSSGTLREIVAKRKERQLLGRRTDLMSAADLAAAKDAAQTLEAKRKFLAALEIGL